MSKNREFDVVLVGATGFVGQQTAAYIARHTAEQHAGLRWAVAGRSKARLQAVLDGLAAGSAKAGLVEADGFDAKALDALAARTRVVLSCAGPFARCGSELVAACVRQGTHYVDITGETPWVRSMIEQHHKAALAQGVKIVPCCGFDSVPSDLGVAMLAHAMRGKGDALAKVKSSFRISGGGFNGGTIASLMNVMESGQADAANDLFLLNPPGTRPADEAAHADPIAPTHDADFDAWLGPFMMGPINSRVVRRSAALRDEPVVYQEYMHMGKGPQAALLATGISMGTLFGQSALKLGAVRRMANRFVPQPGQGPSEAAMNKGRFACDLVGTSAKGLQLRAQVADDTDAGNRATTKFVCESALALVHDLAKLPAGAGVLTPSVAFGGAEEGVLAKRLRAAGMQVWVRPMKVATE